MLQLARVQTTYSGREKVEKQVNNKGNTVTYGNIFFPVKTSDEKKILYSYF